MKEGEGASGRVGEGGVLKINVFIKNLHTKYPMSWPVV